MVLRGVVGASRAGLQLDAYLDARLKAIALAPVTVEQLRRPHVAAMAAFRQSCNHPAGLNFGDCFAYALAESSGEPLLFKGR